MEDELFEIIERRVDAEIEQRRDQFAQEFVALQNRMNARGMLHSSAMVKGTLRLCIDELNARGLLIWRIARESLSRAGGAFDAQAAASVKALIRGRLPEDHPELWGFLRKSARSGDAKAEESLKAQLLAEYNNMLARIDADIDLERYAALHTGNPTSPPPILQRGEFDVFISHASEDKDTFVRPLAEALRAVGIRVWYDEYSLRWGDSLRRSIDGGLAASKFGIVVLSPHFFAKEWPQRELDGLVALELNDGRKRILPIWHNVDKREVAQRSPTLADLLAIPSDHGIEHAVESLRDLLSA